MVTNLAYVNKTTHEVLVAELRHSLLSLFSRCVFHNAAMLSGSGSVIWTGQRHSPASLQTIEDKSSPVNPAVHQNHKGVRKATIGQPGIM